MVKKSMIRYKVFRVGSMQPKKITKLKKADAIKLAKELHAKKGTKGQPYVVDKVERVFEAQ